MHTHLHPEAAHYAHHLTPLDDKRRGHLLAFRLKFKGEHCQGLPSIFANCLVYRTSEGKHEVEAIRANQLIAEMGLQLEAQATTFKTANSFTVQFTGHGL